MNEWNIQSRAHACQACARPFADGQAYHTMLFDEKLGYVRLDVCEECWAAQYSLGATSRKGFISHWQGVYEIPEARPEPIEKENAETLLRKICELNDPKYGAVCFILAVNLERKRVLKVREEATRDGQRVFLYEHPKTGDVFTITDPDLQLDALDQVRQDFERVLEHGLNPPPAPSDAGPTGNVEASPPAASETPETPNAAREPAAC